MGLLDVADDLDSVGVVTLEFDLAVGHRLVLWQAVPLETVRIEVAVALWEIGIGTELVGVERAVVVLRQRVLHDERVGVAVPLEFLAGVDRRCHVRDRLADDGFAGFAEERDAEFSGAVAEIRHPILVAGLT